MHYVHQMVIHLYGVNRPEGKVCVDHIDGDRKNNSIHNLRYTTYYLNLQNPSANEKRRKNASSRSHRGQVIRCIHPHGEVSYFRSGIEAAEKLNCSHVLVYNALNKRGSARRARRCVLEWVPESEVK